MLPTIFERDATGFVTRKFNPEALWVFSEPFIARRLYDGVTLKLDNDGWKFISGRLAKKDGTIEDEWHKIFPKASLMQLIKHQMPESPFAYIEAFEDAQLLFPEMEYSNGLYTLVGYGIGGEEEPALVPYDQAEQLSDVNQLDLTTMDASEAYDTLKTALEPMRGIVYGVLFTAVEDSRRAQLLITDYDWEENDATV